MGVRNSLCPKANVLLSFISKTVVAMVCVYGDHLAATGQLYWTDMT